MNFQVSPVISAVGSPSFVTVTFGESRVRCSGDDPSLQKFRELLSAHFQPVAAPANPATGKVGYRVLFATPEGYRPVNVQADPPGITATQQIAQIEVDVARQMGFQPGEVVLVSLLPIEVSPVRAKVVPEVAAPEEPVPADDEQADGETKAPVA